MKKGSWSGFGQNPFGELFGVSLAMGAPTGDPPMNQGLRAASSAIPTIARVTVSFLISALPSGWVSGLFFIIEPRVPVRGGPILVLPWVVPSLPTGGPGSRCVILSVLRSFSRSMSVFPSTSIWVLIIWPVVLLVPIILANWSWARILVPLNVGH